LTISLELKFKSEENHTPRLQIIFDNGLETRRFSFSNLAFNKDFNNEYFVSASIILQLQHVFWNKDVVEDINVDFSLLFGDKFIEDFSAVKTSAFINQSDNYIVDVIHDHELGDDIELANNSNAKLVFKADLNKLGEIVDNRKRYSILSSANNFFLSLLAIASFPFFLIDGFLASRGLVEKSPYYLKGDSTLKSILFHVNWRTNQFAQFIYGRRTLNISFMKFFYFFAKFRKVQNNKIAFLSERRDDLAGNFEFVYDILKNEKSVDNEFTSDNNGDKKFISDNSGNKKNVSDINEDYKDLKLVKFLKNKPIRSLGFFEMIEFANLIATSKIILLDDFYPNIHNFNLKDETELIQLWHAVGAFKTFGFSRLDKPGGTPQKSPNHRNYDCAIVSSDEIRRFYSEGFGISYDKVIATGIPRTDIFFDEKYKINIRKKLYKKYPFLEDKKVISFIPTFRGEGKEDAFYPLDKFNVEKLFDCLNNPDDYFLIIKHHPFVKNRMKIPEKYKDHAIDLSNESEVNELLFITDIMITDYSSVIFEAALLDISMLLYAYDLEEYIKERGFYYDYDFLVPGKIISSFERIAESINNNDFEEYKLDTFKNKFFDDLDGKSSQRVVDLIFKERSNDKNK